MQKSCSNQNNLGESWQIGYSSWKFARVLGIEKWDYSKMSMYQVLNIECNIQFVWFVTLEY